MFKSSFFVAAFLFVLAQTALADFDVAAGEKVVQRCVTCHSLDGTINKKGPTLRGVVGRPVASLEGYSYSDGLKAFGATGAVWDEATLDKLLQDTIGFVKGMRMVMTPLRREADRANLIAFLKDK